VPHGGERRAVVHLVRVGEETDLLTRLADRGVEIRRRIGSGKSGGRGTGNESGTESPVVVIDGAPRVDDHVTDERTGSSAAE
jgi:hypothetical protein